LELCHFQWVQLALGRAADTGVVFDDEPMDLDAKLSLSPLAWPLRYAYPVRRIGPDHQPDEPPAEATYLIACRDRRDRVRIIESNAVTTRLLQLVAEGEDGRGCCAAIAAELGAPLARIEASALAMLNRLHRLDVVIRTP